MKVKCMKNKNRPNGKENKENKIEGNEEEGWFLRDAWSCCSTVTHMLTIRVYSCLKLEKRGLYSIISWKNEDSYEVCVLWLIGWNSKKGI